MDGTSTSTDHHIIDIPPHPIESSKPNSSDTVWNCSQKECIIYFSQLSVVLVVIIFSSVNLSLKSANSELWASLLSACLGYIMPSPSMEKKKD
jgi:hypothetical protein